MNLFPLQDPAFINGYNKQYFADVSTGWLSIKSMFEGEAVYRLDGGHLTLRDSDYLILNDQQPYSITIDSAHPVESFCIFFPAAWAGDVLRQYRRELAVLLDDPFGETAVSFHNVAHQHDNLVTPHLLKLRHCYQHEEAEPLWQTEQLYRLLNGMVIVQKRVHLEVRKLPAVRRATQDELYRRLEQGRAYLHAHFRTAVSLVDVATAVYLSPFHFARSFKQLYGQTPHTYLTQLRLQEAKKRLCTSNDSITEICLAVGFRSLGSFSTRFQKQTGLSPTAYRQQHLTPTIHHSKG